MTDGRYEALLAFSIVSLRIASSRCPTFHRWSDGIEPYQHAIPEIASVVADREMMSQIDSTLCRIDGLNHRRHMTQSQVDKEQYDGDLAKAQAALEQYRHDRPLFVKALEACYAVYNREKYRDELAQVDEAFKYADAAKKRKHEEYRNFCRDTGREPTPEPPAANKL